MNSIISELRSRFGHHDGLGENAALTKSEVYAVLSWAGAQAGLHTIGEYMVERVGGGKEREIDVVWAVRAKKATGKDLQGGIWVPVAGFEIDGFDTKSGQAKAVDSLSALERDLKNFQADESLVVAGLCLFRCGIKGKPRRPGNVIRWHTSSQSLVVLTKRSRTGSESLVSGSRAQLGAETNVKIFMDEDLICEKSVLPGWIKSARARAENLRNAGLAW